MKSVSYDFHGVARVRVDGLSPFSLEAFNCAYNFFRTADGGAEADLSVAIGPFAPDLAGCANVDHKYFVKKDYLYYRESDKGLRWEAEIRGLEGTGPIRVRYHAPAANRLRFPWGLFPELVLNLYVIQPLLDIVFWRKGHYLLHAAGVERNGKACLIAGRGGAHKTTFVLKLMRQGWNPMGDDMVLLQGGAVKAFPNIVEQLEYLHGRGGTEAMDFRKKLGLFRFLARGEARGLQVTPSARAAAVNLIFVRDCPAPSVRAGLDSHAAAERRDVADAEAFADSLAVNHLMERNTYVGFKLSTASFLDAYAYVFPAAGLQAYPGALRAALRKAMPEIPLRALEVPLRWDDRNTGLLLLGEGETGT